MNAGGERGPVHYQAHVEYGHFLHEDEFDKQTKEVFPIDNIPDVQGGLRRVREDNSLNHYTATCGQVVYRGDRLPEDIRGDIFFSEPVGRLIRRLKITKEDNGMVRLVHPYHEQKEEFIRSNDPNFRVVNAKTAPDGSLYLVDMYRGIIQQGNWTRPGSYLREVIDEYGLAKNIDHGRIWRLRHKDFDLDKTRPNMLNETPAQLVKHLSHPNGWWRDQAQKLIILKGDKSVVAALKSLAKDSKNHFARLHAYWTLEGLDAMDKSTAIAMLNDSHAEVAESGLKLAEPFINESDVKAIYMAKVDGENNSHFKQAMLSLKKTSKRV